MSETNKEKLRNSIDAIESGYEFMLAYAAQGRDFEYTGGGDGPSVRVYLEDMKTGLELVADNFVNVVSDTDTSGAEFSDFIEILKSDAEKSQVAVKMVLSLPSIGSQVIDNLNATIHVRALLTDLFLIDEALTSLSRKPQ
ncbi:MAG: hypothetical protein HOH19_07055 [Kordiimonadaceae bacterium]|jgi:hypothetical protein|nr:hypothetical protein [Kordiimonadaceae bacterium]MBT6032316.1 hypothetical protein [Kordiimonadaceae bacterium]